MPSPTSLTTPLARCLFHGLRHNCAVERGRILPASARYFSTSSSRNLQTPPSKGEDTKKRKSQAELDEELRLKMDGLSGDGGASGVEYENGKPVAMKRSPRDGASHNAVHGLGANDSPPPYSPPRVPARKSLLSRMFLRSPKTKAAATLLAREKTGRGPPPATESRSVRICKRCDVPFYYAINSSETGDMVLCRYHPGKLEPLEAMMTRNGEGISKAIWSCWNHQDIGTGIDRVRCAL
ncbi:hypothetical protein B0T24DRAFT_588656 [Lasiosphaeria ovina]|uniref:Uncharacterized protein n=1 Tax=Lasiosphaeria ovina TaxID=92902 RepID=A0AAE0NM61_9PEZI|nr:hypothetical protein B0T24DRAFT_588656 [Lasiosphaeria ovina]